MKIEKAELRRYEDEALALRSQQPRFVDGWGYARWSPLLMASHFFVRLATLNFSCLDAAHLAGRWLER